MEVRVNSRFTLDGARYPNIGNRKTEENGQSRLSDISYPKSARMRGGIRTLPILKLNLVDSACRRFSGLKVLGEGGWGRLAMTPAEYGPRFSSALAIVEIAHYHLNAPNTRDGKEPKFKSWILLGLNGHQLWMRPSAKLPSYQAL